MAESAKPLTANQWETLNLIVAGKVTMAAPNYRIRGGNPSVVGRLVSMKLARWPKGPVGAQTCEATDAGRQRWGEPRP